MPKFFMLFFPFALFYSVVLWNEIERIKKINSHLRVLLSSAGKGYK